MKKLKLRKRKYKFEISIFMIILLFCVELPCNTYASEIEGEMETVSENAVIINPAKEPEEKNIYTDEENVLIEESSYVARNVAPDKDNKYYYSSNNPFYPSLAPSPGTVDSSGNCTWYAWGRAYEILGYKPSLPTCYAGGWWSANKSLSSGSMPKLGAIACWSNHVAVVEAINGNNIVVSESSYIKGNYSANNLFSQRTLSATNPENGSDIFYGYIYIGDFNSSITDTSLVNLGDTFCAYITNASSGKVLTNDNTNVSIRTRNGATKQLWSFERQSNGTYKIYNVADLRCMDVNNRSYDSGTNVHVYSDNNSDAQRWQIYKSGDAYALSAECTNCVLDIDNGSTSDGANVQMWEDNGTTAQKFKIQKISDSTAPVISNLKVSNITKDGYTVTGKVSDNVGVLRVSCGTWGPGHNEQSAIWGNAPISNGTFTYRVSFSKVKCNSGGGVKRGTYMTDVYVHDASGNSSGYNANTMHATVKVTDTLFDTTKPDITFLRSNDVTNSQFSVRAIATDNLKVEKIEFTCYAPGKNTGVKKTVTATGGSATATFKLNELNTGEGDYRIDAYAYDSAGNKSSVVRTLYVYINCTAPTIENVKTVKTASGSYTLQADIGDPNGIVKVEWITWKPGEKSNSSKGYVLTDTVTNQTSITLTKTIDVTRISGNNPIAYGNYETKIVAYDTYNNKREYSITVPLQNLINTDKDNTGNADNKDKDNGGNSNSTVNNNNSNNNDNENGNNPDPSTSQGKTGTEGFVYRLYNIAMGREADETGFNDWNTQLKNKEKTAAEVARGFIFSEEFKNFNYNNVQYVKILYRTMFGREADEGGLNGWVSDLENGMSREYVYRGFAESAEFTNLCGNYGVERGSVTLSAYRDQNAGATGFIARLYTKMLGRGYDEDGLEYWCRLYLTGERTIENVASDGFLHSEELKNQNLSDEEFVRRMYQTFLNREPDEAGLTDWLGRLSRGEETRDSLVYGFTNSREFGELKKKYNLP